jgi:hypothetical protein
MVRSHKLVEMGVVTGLTIIWILIYIDLPYPPSRWNLLATIGIPSAVALGFEAFKHSKGGRPARLLGFLFWLSFLLVWEFVSVGIALIIHGT